MNRLAIAATVWLVGVPFYAATMFSVMLLTVVYGNPSGHGNDPESPVPYIALALAPALVALAVTRLMSGYVARSSNGMLHAGPIAVGLGPGLFAGLFVNVLLGGRAGFGAALTAAIAGQLTGALLGTFIPVPMKPAMAATCALVIAAIAVVFGLFYVEA